jgi:hypothetical protein
MHGGSTPSGIASPHFKTGRYSKDLPPLIAGRYEEALANRGEMLKLYDEIALIDTRIADLCQRFESGERDSLWEDIQETLADLDAAKQAGEGIEPFLDQLQAIVRKGRETIQTWRDLEAAIHAKAKLVSIEGKRQKDMGETMTKDEANTIFRHLTTVIKRHVTDPQTLTAMAQDFKAYIPGARQNAADKPTVAPASHQFAENATVQPIEANPTSPPSVASPAG